VRSTPHTDRLYEHHHYHVSGGLLEQVLAYVRRAIRVDDKMIVYERAGAALVFPDINDQSAQQILERIYSNLRLLQAETLLPPLTRETNIQLGIGKYSATKTSLKLFQCSVESQAHCLILRPALRPQQEHQQPASPYGFSLRQYNQREQLHPELMNAPFMQLPAALPSSIKQLIPHAMACELHCAPIGREHNHLTVAMQDPANIENVRHLQKITGMTIFPVSCEEKALASLLTTGW
jgi:Type II secretion system (T2SS), protein E, N-terminal domain